MPLGVEKLKERRGMPIVYICLLVCSETNYNSTSSSRMSLRISTRSHTPPNSRDHCGARPGGV